MLENNPKLSIGYRPPRNLGLTDRGTIELRNSQDDSIVMLFLITKNNDDLVKEGFNRVYTNVVAIDKNDKVIGKVVVEGQFHAGVPNDDLVYEPVDDLSKFSEADVVFRVWNK